MQDGENIDPQEDCCLDRPNHVESFPPLTRLSQDGDSQVSPVRPMSSSKLRVPSPIANRPALAPVADQTRSSFSQPVSTVRMKKLSMFPKPKGKSMELYKAKKRPLVDLDASPIKAPRQAKLFAAETLQCKKRRELVLDEVTPSPEECEESLMALAMSTDMGRSRRLSTSGPNASEEPVDPPTGRSSSNMVSEKQSPCMDPHTRRSSSSNVVGEKHSPCMDPHTGRSSSSNVVGEKQLPCMDRPTERSSNSKMVREKQSPFTDHPTGRSSSGNMVREQQSPRGHPPTGRSSNSNMMERQSRRVDPPTGRSSGASSMRELQSPPAPRDQPCSSNMPVTPTATKQVAGSMSLRQIEADLEKKFNVSLNQISGLKWVVLSQYKMLSKVLAEVRRSGQVTDELLERCMAAPAATAGGTSESNVGEFVPVNTPVQYDRLVNALNANALLKSDLVSYVYISAIVCMVTLSESV